MVRHGDCCCCCRPLPWAFIQQALWHSLAHVLVDGADALEGVTVQEPHCSLHPVGQPAVHLFSTEVGLSSIRQRQVPAPHIAEHRHVLCVGDDVWEHAAQRGIDAGEHLGTAQKTSRTTLRDEDPTRVELLKDHTPVEILRTQPAAAPNTTGLRPLRRPWQPCTANSCLRLARYYW